MEVYFKLSAATWLNLKRWNPKKNTEVLYLNFVLTHLRQCNSLTHQNKTLPRPIMAQFKNFGLKKVPKIIKISTWTGYQIHRSAITYSKNNPRKQMQNEQYMIDLN